MTAETRPGAPARSRASPPEPVAPPAPGEPWTVLSLIRWSSGWLSGRGVPEPRLSAEHLLAHVLEMDRLGLYLAFDRPLAPDELGQFKPLLKRRARHEPLQYIVGRTAFRQLELRTDGRGLIPRPETEELLDIVLGWARARPASTLDLLDVGTGTGAIALSARVEGVFGRVVATDCSAPALELARENATDLGADVDFREGSIYEPVRDGERFDIVASNPPYIANAEIQDLELQVRDWEPWSALNGGAEGLDLIEILVSGAPKRMRPGGLLVIEIGHDQGDAVRALAGRTEGLGEPHIRRDLAGRDRFLVVETGAD